MRRIRLSDRLVNLEWVLLLAITFVGVVLRLQAQDHLRVISPDGVEYIDHVLGVLEGAGNFGRRGPFFQFLLMISYKIFGVSFESSIIVPQFFGSIIPILLFLLGRHFFDRKTGLIAALLGSLNPMLINLSCWVLRETLTLALILITILIAHSTIRIQSIKRSLMASILPGFLSGLIILTRDEFIFVIPPAFIAYIYLYNKRSLDFITRTSVFLIAIIFTMAPWLLYSFEHFGEFYSYGPFIEAAIKVAETSGGQAVDGAKSVPFFLAVLPAIFLGLWKEMTELPAIFSLLGFALLPIGAMFTIRKRAIWIIYLIMALDLFLLSPILSSEKWIHWHSMPHRWEDPGRLIFSAVMPANVIIAYGIRRLGTFVSDLKKL